MLYEKSIEEGRVDAERLVRKLFQETGQEMIVVGSWW